MRTNKESHQSGSNNAQGPESPTLTLFSQNTRGGREDNMANSYEKVTVAVINFNGMETVKPTLESVLDQKSDCIAEVLLIDNHSTDSSVDLVRTLFGAKVRVVAMPSNRGPNPARNRALHDAKTPLVLIMDNDIILAPDYVDRLASVLGNNTNGGAVSGQIRLNEQRETIQYNGAFIHYAGEIVANHTNSKDAMVVGVIPTGALMVRKSKASAVGFLDEDFVFGWTDGDFTFRLTVCGFPCYVDSQAICYHMKRNRGMKWVRYQVRNRWWFILKNYDLRTLILAMPGILFYQLCAGGFFLLRGQAPAFFRGYLDVILTLPAILRKRCVIMRMKRVHDFQALCGGKIELPDQVRQNKWAMLVGNVVSMTLSLYWKLIRNMLLR